MENSASSESRACFDHFILDVTCLVCWYQHRFYSWFCVCVSVSCPASFHLLLVVCYSFSLDAMRPQLGFHFIVFFYLQNHNEWIHFGTDTFLHTITAVSERSSPALHLYQTVFLGSFWVSHLLSCWFFLNIFFGEFLSLVSSGHPLFHRLWMTSPNRRFVPLVCL